MALKPIALIKTGGTIDYIKSRYGDFEDWFAAGLGVEDLMQVDVYRNQPLPDPETLSGIVITGSAAMVSERQDWSERTAEWLGGAVNSGTPTLGICYGHQLLAHALGGEVGLNPAGRQIGTVTTQLIDNGKKDPLFTELPDCFSVQTSHSEVVLKPPPNTERLATSPLDENFAIKFAEKVWGVQFHPEFSGQIMSEYIRYRSDDIRKEGLDPDKLLENVTETDLATSVLKRFTQLLTA
jgi:GMP synthase (glutamine-hydrolysing)